MNSLPWWGNFIGYGISVTLYTGGLMLMGWWKGDPIPAWAFYLAASIGIISWSRPTYSQRDHFNARDEGQG